MADQIQLYVRAGAGPLLPLPSQGKPACLPVRVLHTTLLPTWTWWLYRLVHGERGPFAPACAAGCRMPAYQLKNLFSSSSSLPSHIVYQPTFPDMSDYKIHLLHRRLLLPALLCTVVGESGQGYQDGTVRPCWVGAANALYSSKAARPHTLCTTVDPPPPSCPVVRLQQSPSVPAACDDTF